MIALRRSRDRGHANHGWLDSHHTFSFADYYDPAQMGFSVLRVLNEDRVAPGMGFGTHPHRDMEIITYVLEGALQHQDSLGNGSVIRPGDVQRMSAGTGVTHSEMNASPTDPVHFLQIWILPDRPGLQPGYEQKSFAPETRTSRLKLVASPDGRDGSVTVHQDVFIHAAILNEDDTLEYHFEPGRRGYLQVATGDLVVDGHLMRAGDGARISQADQIALGSPGRAEILLFDLP
ncbi:MAG: pirin family protein [Betaproteobacteria bacterium]|nr:pirin family protein [Betaproteobacteria bacterium]